MCRAHTDEREKAAQDDASVERKLSELFRVLSLDSQYRQINNVVSSLEHVLNKVSAVFMSVLLQIKQFEQLLGWRRGAVGRVLDLRTRGRGF